MGLNEFREWLESEIETTQETINMGDQSGGVNFEKWVECNGYLTALKTVNDNLNKFNVGEYVTVIEDKKDEFIVKRNNDELLTIKK